MGEIENTMILPEEYQGVEYGKEVITNLRELTIGEGDDVIYANAEGTRWGSREFDTANAWIKNDGTYSFKSTTGDLIMDTDGVQAGALEGGTSLYGWTSDITFHSEDIDTVRWDAGDIELSDGTIYSILADNTGNIAGLTYMYLDIDVSETEIQLTTTSSDAVGMGKIMLGIAKPSSTGANFQVFGGEGGLVIGTENLENDLITSAKIVDDAVTNIKIATDAITETKIEDNAITTVKIDALAITTVKIDALAITTEKIDANAITAAKITSGTITSTEIAANTITAGDIASNTITANEITGNTITASELTTGAFVTSTANITDAIITSAKISSLNADVINAGTITGINIVGGEFRSTNGLGVIWTETNGDINIKGADDVIFNAGNANRCQVTTGAFKPIDATYDLGTSTDDWVNGYINNVYTNKVDFGNWEVTTSSDTMYFKYGGTEYMRINGNKIRPAGTYESSDGTDGTDFSSIGFVTDIQISGSSGTVDLDAKFREFTVKDGIVTNMTSETGWIFLDSASGI